MSVCEKNITPNHHESVALEAKLQSARNRNLPSPGTSTSSQRPRVQMGEWIDDYVPCRKGGGTANKGDAEQLNDIIHSCREKAFAVAVTILGLL